MKLIIALISIIAILTPTQPTVLVSNKNKYDIQEEEDICPPWTIRSESSVLCECGKALPTIVSCDIEHQSNSSGSDYVTLSVSDCYCMTYSNILDKVVVGNCFYTCTIHGYDILHPEKMIISSKSELNNITCGYYNRTGPMCGKCRDGFAIPVYSYSLSCVECSDYKYNWLKYIAIAFLPLTIFYFIVIFFRISVTSGSMVAYVTVSQMASAPTFIRIMYKSFKIVSTNYFGFKVIASIVTVWNLDVFRSLYAPFCIHPNMTTVQALALDYIVGVYPLFLIFITFMFVKLHNRFRVIVLLWRPFYKCFARYRNQWDIRTSLVHSFATFLLLSYVKILNVSFDLLTPSTHYTIDGNPLNTYLYNDGTMIYLGKHHYPYAILAIIMTVLFNIIPLILLCLYPCRCFQKCLNYCRIHSLTLYTFMDIFQGCYRHEPRDYRHFASFYFVLKIINLLILSTNRGPTYIPIAGFIALFAVIIVAITKPYKEPQHNITDLIILLLLEIVLFIKTSLVYMKYDENNQHLITLCHIMITFSLVVFLLYGVALVLYRLLPQRIAHKLATYKQHLRAECRLLNKRSTEVEESLPHRLQYIDEYAPLINVSTTRK